MYLRVNPMRGMWDPRTWKMTFVNIDLAKDQFDYSLSRILFESLVSIHDDVRFPISWYLIAFVRRVQCGIKFLW